MIQRCSAWLKKGSKFFPSERKRYTSVLSLQGGVDIGAQEANRSSKWSRKTLVVGAGL